MPSPNESYWRSAAAEAVLALVQHDRPTDVQELRRRVLNVIGLDEDGSFKPDTIKAVASWCKGLNILCEAIEFRALTLALAFSNSGSSQDDDVASADEPVPPSYELPWIAGESKSRFLRRAEAEFYRLKHAHGEIAPAEINPRHVEWLVRFQVHEDGYERIAKADHVDRNDVKRAVRRIALLLQLPLRPTRPGSPRGSRGPRSPAFHVVRHK